MGNSAESRRGRPKKDSDPQNTAALFMPDNSVNPVIVDIYDDFAGESESIGEVSQGTLWGGEGYSDAGLLRELWRRGHDDRVPPAAQINALIKCGQLRERLQASDSRGEMGDELSAFCALVKAQRVQ